VVDKRGAAYGKRNLPSGHFSMSLLIPRTIATVQLIGSLLAAVYLLGSDGIEPDVDLRGLSGLLRLLCYALFGLAFYAGVRLWRGSPEGVRLSRLLQMLQIPIISTSVFVYNFYTGLQIGAVLEWPNAHVIFDFGSNFNVTINYAGGDPERRFTIGINLLAVILLRLLDKWRVSNARGSPRAEVYATRQLQ
jgi:hypothetical protein